MVPNEQVRDAAANPAEQSGTDMMVEAERLSTALGQQTKGKTEDEILSFLDADIGSQASFQTPTDAPEAKPAPEPEEEAEAQEETAEEAQEAPAEDDLEAEPDQDLERALSALRRYKTPDAVLKSMDRDQLIRWGSHLAKIQGDYDKTYTTLREMQDSESDPNAGEQVPTRAEAAPSVDIGATTKKLAEVLGLDEQDGQILDEVFTGIVEPLRRELSERAQRDAARDTAVASILMDTARSRLVERFPQLGDEAKFAPVQQKMQQLIRGGGYDNVASAMEDAAWIIYGKEMQAARSSQQDSKNLAKAKGRPAAPTSKTPPAALSHDERLTTVLQKLEAGATQEEARAAAGW